MAAQIALATIDTSLGLWGALFAREPEPDPDLDDIPTGSMDRGRSGMAPVPPPHRSSRKPLILFLLLLLIAAGTYLYMEPDTLRGLLPESVMDLLGEAPPPPAPMGSDQGPAAPPLGSAQANREEGSPPQSPATSSLPAAPGEPPSATGPGAMGPAMPPPGMPSREPNRPETASAPGSTPEPRFGEGQLVIVRRDPAVPDQPVPLAADAAGTKPGPLVRAGTVVRVLDGDLQGHVWVYSVKTPEGSKGWLAEDRLQATQP